MVVSHFLPPQSEHNMTQFGPTHLEQAAVVVVNAAIAQRTGKSYTSATLDFDTLLGANQGWSSGEQIMLEAAASLYGHRILSENGDRGPVTVDIGRAFYLLDHSHQQMLLLAMSVVGGLCTTTEFQRQVDAVYAGRDAEKDSLLALVSAYEGDGVGVRQF